MLDTTTLDTQSLRALLTREHAQLDELFERLQAAVRADDRAEAIELWSEFETRLAAHMKLEEREILPSFALEYPTEAENILAEHALIRSTLVEVGVGMDLHFARAEVIERFIWLLRAHAQREDAVLYAWSQARLGPRERANVLERLLVRLKQMPAALAHGLLK
ncbi:MAG TPA: hemerythrin domain-containing protein [Polyangiales bacterium]|nr:hemerythrin domain-containing protein [Polyangiales bacterium]